MTEDWKYRKKGKDIIIEKDRKQMIQLPRDPKKTYGALISASNKAEESASNLSRTKEEITDEKGGYDILSELDKVGISRNKIHNELNKLVDELLNKQNGSINSNE